MNGILSAVSSTVPMVTGGPSITNIQGGSGGSFGPGGSSGITVAPTGGPGLVPLVGVFAEAFALVVVMAVVGVLVIVVVANRADPDPSGRRPQSVYFFAVSFVTLLTSIIGSSVVVSALVRLIGSHSSPIGNSIARLVVLGGLITLVSMVLLITHLRRGLVLVGTESMSPSRRVGQTYVSAVAFLAVLVLLVVTVLSAYLVFAIAGPGVFGSFGGRVPAIRYLIDAVYLGVVAGLILWTHRNLVPPGLHVLGDGGGAAGLPGDPPTAAVPPPNPST